MKIKIIGYSTTRNGDFLRALIGKEEVLIKLTLSTQKFIVKNILENNLRRIIK